MDDARQREIAERQSSIRAANERDAARRAATGARRWLPLMCECGLPDCAAMVAAPGAGVAEARRHRDRFVVAPGHVVAAVERVVHEAARHWVVEKVGVGAEVALRRTADLD